jgi:3-hydroxybutyryl-CoA dehydrogenase
MAANVDLNAIKTVAVLGAGTMGQGIAQVCAMTGFRTLLFDTNTQQVSRALANIKKNVQRAVDGGKLSKDQQQQVESNLASVSELRGVIADLIVEAVVEKLEVKQNLFRELEQWNAATTVFATNTSSLSVSQIAAALRDPSRCIGLHFFNPADRMKLVEIILGRETLTTYQDLMRDFSERIGKTAVVAADTPGFIVNRVARHFYLEALKVLEDGVARVAETDRLLRSAGFKMGPFELMDLIGIDINYAVTLSTYEAFHHLTRFKPSLLQEDKVRAGLLGRKSGQGFYHYDKPGPEFRS